MDRPTLLGNIIATYELYPSTRYGIDGEFYWNHLLCLAPKQARVDWDEDIAFAESLLLTSAASFLVGGVGALFLLGRLVAILLPGMVLIDTPESLSIGVLNVLMGLVGAFLFYRLALPAYREAGRSFRVIADLALPHLHDWIRAAPTAPPGQAVGTRASDVREYLAFLCSSPDLKPSGDPSEPND